MIVLRVSILDLPKKYKALNNIIKNLIIVCLFSAYIFNIFIKVGVIAKNHLFVLHLVLIPSKSLTGLFYF